MWKAHDPRLSRDVAIKVLPPEFAADADRQRRFEREARAIAGLNHPHICQIYDIGPGYLVLEHIDGTTPRGPLPPGEAVQMARQINGRDPFALVFAPAPLDAGFLHSPRWRELAAMMNLPVTSSQAS